MMQARRRAANFMPLLRGAAATAAGGPTGVNSTQKEAETGATETGTEGAGSP